MDTFKGIQEQDDKRRRSSLFSNHVSSSNKNSVSHDVHGNHSSLGQLVYTNQPSSSQQAQHLPSKDVTSALVTPIPVPAVKPNFEFFRNNGLKLDDMSDIDPTQGATRELQLYKFIDKTGGDNLIDGDPIGSSFMSLPLTGSFASLDSINDEVLHLKYKPITITDPNKQRPITSLRKRSSFLIQIYLRIITQPLY